MTIKLSINSSPKFDQPNTLYNAFEKFNFVASSCCHVFNFNSFIFYSVYYKKVKLIHGFKFPRFLLF